MSITLTKEISISVMTLIIGCLLGMGGASTSLAIEIPAPVASAPANSPSATDASEELNDAKNFAFNEIRKAEVAIGDIDKYSSNCWKVSDSFVSGVKKLYDATTLSYYCDTLDIKLLKNRLISKLLALKPSESRTVDAANAISDKAYSIAKEADYLAIQIQDITDELAATQEQFSSISNSLMSLNEAGIYVFDSWDNLNKRFILTPSSSKSTLQKSPSYKNSSVYVAQLKKVLDTRDTLLGKLYSLKDPRKMRPITTQLSELLPSDIQLSSFEKSIDIINRGIPSKVCTKGPKIVLPSKSGSCPTGYKKTSTS